MKISVSNDLNADELLDLNSNLETAFPHCRRVGDDEEPNILIISRQNFKAKRRKTLVPITPTAIKQMVTLGIDGEQIQIPKTGFINLNFFQKKIYVYGFGERKKKEIFKQIESMGGIIEPKFTDGTNFFVAKTINSVKSHFALEHSITVLNPMWVFDNYNSDNYIDHQNYKIKIFSGLVFAFSPSMRNSMQNISKMITENDGIVQPRITSKTKFLIIPPEGNVTPIVNLAVDLNINITTVEQIIDSINNHKFLDSIIPPCACSNVFHGVSFKVDENLPKSVQMQIIQNGGQISDNPRFFISMSSNKPNSRTPIWIERCINEGKLLEPEIFIFYSPVNLTCHNCHSLRFCIVGFSGNQFKDIIYTCKWIGCRYTFVLRKYCTHLITNNQDDEKIKYAKEWGITICTYDWLISFVKGVTGSQLEKYILYQPDFLSDFSDSDCVEINMPETTQTVAVESPKSKEPESEIQFLDPSSSYSNFEEEITIIEKNATQKSIVSTPPPPPPSFLDQDDDILDILSSVSDHENPKIPPNVLSSPRKSNPRVSNPLRQDAVMNRINDVMRKIASASSRLRNEDSGLDLDSLESFTQVPESRDGAPSDLYEVAYDNSTRTAYGEMRNEGSDPLLELMQELGSN